MPISTRARVPLPIRVLWPAMLVAGCTTFNADMTAVEKLPSERPPVVKPAPIQSGCLITLSACPSHPNMMGTFADHHIAANRTLEACLKRRTDYARFCQSDNVKVAFVQHGEIQVQGSAGECRMVSSFCPLKDQTVAKPDFKSCTEFVRETLEQCTSDHAHLTFSANGEVLTDRIEGAYCQVTQPLCPRHPEYAGSLIINRKMTGSAECMPLAEAYRSWCGSESSRAEYFSLGVLVERRIATRK